MFKCTFCDNIHKYIQFHDVPNIFALTNSLRFKFYVFKVYKILDNFFSTFLKTLNKKSCILL